MDLQRTQGMNFGARRVLSVTKGNSAIDIFKLDPQNVNDRSFIRRCNKTFSQGAKDVYNAYMPSFFRSFLDKNDSCFDYYIGIKNSERIIGGYKTYNISDYVLVQQHFTNYKDKITKDSLLYSLIADSQKNQPDKTIERIPSAISKDYTFSPEQINDAKKEIKKHNKEYKFNDGDSKKIDLEEYMGIDSFEDRILI